MQVSPVVEGSTDCRDVEQAEEAEGVKSSSVGEARTDCIAGTSKTSRASERSRKRKRVNRLKKYGFKTKGLKCWSEMQPEIERVIELLKVPKDSRRVMLETKMRMNQKWFEARRMKFQPLFGEV